MRKRLGSGPAARASFDTDTRMPHPALEHPRMIRAGQPNEPPAY